MVAEVDQKRQNMLNSGPHEHVASEGNIKSTIAQLLLEKLENECSSYCILTGYEELPSNFDSDIDFMVGTQDFERIPVLINEIAAESNTLLFQSIAHEASGRAFRLATEVGDRIAFIQPDSCADYRHYGKLWLKADEILANRRAHSNGFWIPGAAEEFIYYLIKRLNKKDFQEIHGEKLTKLYVQDPGKCVLQLERFWKPDSVKKIETMARTGNWTSLSENLIQFREELWRTPSQKRGTQLTSYIRSCSHTLERIVQPTGASIAFIGPDGCGKSSVIEAIEREFKPAYQQVVRFHLRPKSLPARDSGSAIVTDPHGKPAKGVGVSIAKMLYLAFDYWIGYCLKARNDMMRTRLVIFDRYFYDNIVDPRRVLYVWASMDRTIAW